MTSFEGLDPRARPSARARLLLRDGSVAFWSVLLAMAALLVAVLLVPAVTLPQEDAAPMPSARQLRDDLLSFRGELSLLVVLARQGDPGLFDRASALAEIAEASAASTPEGLSGGYEELAVLLRRVAALSEAAGAPAVESPPADPAEAGAPSWGGGGSEADLAAPVAPSVPDLGSLYASPHPVENEALALIAQVLAITDAMAARI